MKRLIDPKLLKILKRQWFEKLSEVKRLSIHVYQQLQQVTLKQKRIVILVSSSVGFLLLVIIVGVGVHESSAKRTPTFSFSTLKKVKKPLNVPVGFTGTQAAQQALQAQVNQLTQHSTQAFRELQMQLQRIEAQLASVPSSQDLEALQTKAHPPDTALLNKMDFLQQSIQKIETQTTQPQWVNPSQVEKYFRLVAVQGFSDGMRAILDVDGNQTTLGIHEPCPVCRGWRVQRLDFASQRAVFSKRLNGKTQYVKLQVN